MKLTRRVLHHTAKPVEFRYPWQNERLVQELLDLMTAENGIGLAAPQVGISQRVFVMKIGLKSWACFNPEIIKSGDDFVLFDEGCLSFPGESCSITRPNSIEVSYQTAQGQEVKEQLTGLAARCFQHELDHLDGITMHDRKAQHAI